MKKYIITLAIVFFVPSIAFASWWNPMTWSIFSSPPRTNPQIQVIATTTVSNQPRVNISTSTAKTITSNKTDVITIPTPPVNKPAKKDTLPVSNPQATNNATSPKQSACPLGYSCIPLEPLPATTTCPVGFVCAPIAPVQQTTTSSVATTTPYDPTAGMVKVYGPDGKSGYISKDGYPSAGWSYSPIPQSVQQTYSEPKCKTGYTEDSRGRCIFNDSYNSPLAICPPGTKKIRSGSILGLMNGFSDNSGYSCERF